MVAMRSLVLLLVFVALSPVLSTAQDPASSWLAYTIAEGNGRLVTLVNATWTVPSNPSTPYGSNAPGWWFGIEPTSMDDLIQPILAYGDGSAEFTIFNGRFTWAGMNWWQSSSGVVQPGNTIVSYVKWKPAQSAYEMYIMCKETGWSVTSMQPVSGEVFSNVVFVTEHQPNTCAAYPANDQITFTDIHVEWENQPHNPKWQAKLQNPACGSQAHVLSPFSVKFTWQS